MNPNHATTTSAITSAAPSSGGNGAGTSPEAADPRAVLQAMMAQGGPGSIPEPTGPPPPVAETGPEDAPAPTEGDAAGQTISSETEESSQGGDESPSGDESRSNPSPEIPAELAKVFAGLSDTEREAALTLAKSLQPGEIPRIAKLVAQRHAAEQTIEALQKQNEELQAKVQNPQSAVSSSQGLPAAVAGLKTIAEVEARQESVEANVDALSDFLDANPGSADTSYQIGEQEFTRQQLIDRRAALRAELKALPRRAQQIAKQGELTRAQAQARAQIEKDFPVLQDPEHPDTKVARQLLKDPRFAGEVNADYMALALARGHRELQAELAARKGKGNGTAAFSTAASRGKVPLGKPHAPNGGAGPKPAAGNGAAAVKLAKPGEELDRGSFATLVALSGR